MWRNLFFNEDESVSGSSDIDDDGLKVGSPTTVLPSEKKNRNTKITGVTMTGQERRSSNASYESVNEIQVVEKKVIRPEAQQYLQEKLEKETVERKSVSFKELREKHFKEVLPEAGDENIRLNRGSIFFFSKPNEEEVKELAGQSPLEYWGKLVSNWEDTAEHRGKVCRLIGQGIPNTLRGIVWSLLANTQNSPNRDRYAALLQNTSSHEEQIRKDLARTFPHTDFFNDADGAGQETMFRVIKAYSLYDSEMGYCQGVAFIVGILVLVLPEEEAFVVLIYIMEKMLLRKMFLPGMPLIRFANVQFALLLEDKHPDISERFRREGIHHPMYLTKWMMTVFGACLPLPVVLHLMDWLLAEAILRPYGALEMIYQISLAILADHTDFLMTHTLDEILPFLTSGILKHYSEEGENEGTVRREPNAQSRKLVKEARSINLNYKDLDYWKNEYKKRSKESELKKQKVNKLSNQNKDLNEKYSELVKKHQKLKEGASTLIDDLQKEKAKLLERITKLEGQIKSVQSDKEIMKEEIKRLRTMNEKISTNTKQEREMVKSHMLSQSTKIKELEKIIGNLSTENQRLKEKA